MLIESLRLENFRNLTNVDIQLSKKLNVIYGDNGKGKTSLLEAVFLLGFGRSFRTNSVSSILNQEKDRFVVFSKLLNANCEGEKAACLYDRSGGLSFKINNRTDVKLAELVKLVPVQVFTPQSTELVTGSPKERRRFVDWLLFHVEPGFMNVHKRFTKCLKHRNAILKQLKNPRGKLSSAHNEASNETQLEFWTNEFAESALILDSMRAKMVDRIIANFELIKPHFLPELPIEIVYNRGWPKSSRLIDELKIKRRKDDLYGYTTVGPHKADLILKSGSRPIADTLSRGQLRLAVSILLLAQVQVFAEYNNEPMIFLVDDMAAELDVGARQRFLQYILGTDTQLFVSAIELDQLGFLNDYNDKKVFHVEHSTVKEE